MLTLNQIKHTLIAWFNNHAQINNVTYESDFDFNAERNLIYPVVNIEYKYSNTSDKLINHLYLITIADLTDPNILGHDDEILNDTTLIAEDFLAWLQSQEEGLIFSKSSSIQPFYSDTHDRVSGITLGVTISVIRSQNTCQIPVR